MKILTNNSKQMYEGEHLNDIVESICEHDVLNPVIVWKTGESYEMFPYITEPIRGDRRCGVLKGMNDGR